MKKAADLRMKNRGKDTHENTAGTVYVKKYSG
jgi:hypothetical protein